MEEAKTGTIFARACFILYSDCFIAWTGLAEQMHIVGTSGSCVASRALPGICFIRGSALHCLIKEFATTSLAFDVNCDAERSG